MVKLSTILEEVSALESKIQKVASSKANGTSLASFLDKIAEEAEKGEDSEKKEDSESKGEEGKEEEKKEDEKKFEFGETKESRMRLTDSDIQKIAQAVMKIAVLDNEQTQGSVVTVGENKVDGAAVSAARATDQIIPGASVEAAAESNPQKHNTSTSSDLIEGEAINEKDMAVALKEGKLVLYSRQDAEVLEKFAGIGYNHVVDVYSDQIVQEKVAAAIIAEQAKDAPQKIAKAVLNKNTKTASNKNEVVSKLAHIKKNDPQLFAALKVMADRKLL
jgi:hypothetical protein